MKKTKNDEPDSRSQRQKFIDAAREHGASEDLDVFENALRKVATAPANPKTASKPKP